ncbi:hypothetical protein [Paraburkholderia acidisoli]|uniref:DUF4148 domain-containing protein n=1 Tax=Paraburkholderia acidisoli TaxID=2571748 RepID=A0A7Z2GPW6_9BURK|nr:hypothetical protein [Paraburkholderia acidisoli]QGZ65530.1 hypothetical protein FAZ98_27685 [Paraburkholderia acidisoli]
MIRIARTGFIAASLAFLALLATATEVQAQPASTAQHAPHSKRPADLAKATRLVDQSRQLVSHAHRRDPHAYGGHEARAAALLRRAALELDEASVYQRYNQRKGAPKASSPAHRAPVVARRGHSAKAA